MSNPDGDAGAALAARLNDFALPEDDVEIEREMLDALEQLSRLEAQVNATGLPVVETGHRVVAGDLCHFSAPASMPDDPAQPCGRLFLTSRRAIFLGGPGATTIAWHATRGVARHERDVILLNDRETLYRFRCNTFGDALCGAFLAGRLIGVLESRKGSRTPE